MTKLDMRWAKNPEWYEVIKYGEYKIKDSAPEEAKESFKNYQKQIKGKADSI